MSHINRPTQISTILKTIGTGAPFEISDELETYIAGLEAKQPNRPARITEILRSIGAQYPAYIEDSLEPYIAGLESSQQPVKREHHRKKHVLQKLNDYR